MPARFAPAFAGLFAPARRRRPFRTNDPTAAAEVLEDRTLLAGDVRVIQSGADVFVLGDVEDNGIEITQAAGAAAGEITVRGGTTFRGGFNRPTSVNGAFAPVAATVGPGGTLVILAGEGRDFVDLGSGDRDEPASPIRLPGDLYIDAAGENSTIDIRAVDVGDGYIAAILRTTEQGFLLLGGAGPSVAGDIYAYSGDGRDSVSVTDFVADNLYVSLGGADEDLFTSVGNQFSGSGLDLRESAQIYGGAGNDRILISDVRVAAGGASGTGQGFFYVVAGDGRVDLVQAGNVAVGTTADSVFGLFTQGGNDTVTVAGEVSDGSGGEGVSAGVTTPGFAFAVLGEGDDRMDLRVSDFGAGQVYGGAGADSLTVDAAVSEHPNFDLFEIENFSVDG